MSLWHLKYTIKTLFLKHLGGHDYPYCPAIRRKRSSVQYKNWNKPLFIFFRLKKNYRVESVGLNNQRFIISSNLWRGRSLVWNPKMFCYWRWLRREISVNIFPVWSVIDIYNLFDFSTKRSERNCVDWGTVRRRCPTAMRTTASIRSGKRKASVKMDSKLVTQPRRAWEIQS